MKCLWFIQTHFLSADVLLVVPIEYWKVDILLCTVNSVTEHHFVSYGFLVLQNYRHCFSENTTAIQDLNQRYEILNSTGLNFIKWKTWMNDSIYQFRVQVIDPQYRLVPGT